MSLLPRIDTRWKLEESRISSLLLLGWDPRTLMTSSTWFLTCSICHMRTFRSTLKRCIDLLLRRRRMEGSSWCTVWLGFRGLQLVWLLTLWWSTGIRWNRRMNWWNRNDRLFAPTRGSLSSWSLLKFEWKRRRLRWRHRQRLWVKGDRQKRSWR